MQYSYGSTLSKIELVSWIESGMDIVGKTPDEEDPSISFLLQVAPLLHRYETAKQKINAHHTIAHHQGDTCPPARTADIEQALQDCFDIHQEFLQRFCPSQAVVPPPTGLPVQCPGCHQPSTFVDIRESASYNCTSCGLVEPYSFPAGKESLSYADQHNRAPSPYMYRPDVYFRKILDEAQGLHRGSFPPELLPQLDADLKKRHVCTRDISPTEIRAALKRLRKPEFYPCRWYLAMRLNSSFQPISIPHPVMQQCLALFSGMRKQFPRVIQLLHLHRTNLPSYPFLAQQMLLQLGYPQFAAVFGSLKSEKRHRIQSIILTMIFVALLPPPRLGTKR